MKSIFLFIISLFASFSFFGQSQMLNGISIDGPRGFEKSAELTWTKGNDVVNVMSIKGFLSQDDYEAECKKGSRTTEYLGSEKIEINGEEYIICIQMGDNDLLIGQAVVFREEHSYVITVGTYPGDYESSERIDKSYGQIGYMMGYMLTRIKTF